MDIYSDRNLKGKNLVEPQFASMWVIELPPLNTLPNTPSGYAPYSSAFVSPRQMDLYIKSTTLPLRKLEYEKTNTNLITPKGRAQYSSFTMSFIETADFGISKYFDYWLNSIYDFTDTAQLYKPGFELNKLDITIKFLRFVNNTPNTFFALASTIQQINLLNQGWKIYKTSTFTLKRCLIAGFEDISLENESGDPLEIEVEFECENVEIDRTFVKIDENSGTIANTWNPYA